VAQKKRTLLQRISSQFRIRLLQSPRRTLSVLTIFVANWDGTVCIVPGLAFEGRRLAEVENSEENSQIYIGKTEP
jgi:hypothetical protein